MHGVGARMGQRQEEVGVATGGAEGSHMNGVAIPRAVAARERSGEIHSENGSDVVMIPESQSSSLRAGREWLRWGSVKAESLLAASKATGNSSKSTLKSSGRSERNLHEQSPGFANLPHNGEQTAPLDVKSGDVVTSPPRPQEDAPQRQNQNRAMHAAQASHAQIQNAVRSDFTRERGKGGLPRNMNVRTVRSSGTHSSGGEASEKLPDNASRSQEPRPNPAPPVKDGPTYVRFLTFLSFKRCSPFCRFSVASLCSSLHRGWVGQEGGYMCLLLNLCYTPTCMTAQSPIFVEAIESQARYNSTILCQLLAVFPVLLCRL